MFIIEGIVEHGDARGRELGFRTANIAPRTVRPDLEGVWTAMVTLPSGRDWPSTVSIGRRSTFYREGGAVLLEAHLLDFVGDLYGQSLSVQLLNFQRPQYHYDNVEDLVTQLYKDVAQTRLWVSRSLAISA